MLYAESAFIKKIFKFYFAKKKVQYLEFFKN